MEHKNKTRLKYLGTENKVVIIKVQGMWEESEMGKRSQFHVNE